MTPAPTYSRTAVAAELDSARHATTMLLAPFDDEELATQWSPLQSPLVWDLAHIGHFEDLWIGQRIGGLPPLLDEGEELYDAFMHERSGRGELPLLRPDAARDYVAARARADPRDARARRSGGRRSAARARVRLRARRSSTSASTARRCSRRSSSPAACIRAAARSRSARRRRGASSRPGRSRMGTTDDAWAYDNERPAHEAETGAFRDRPGPVTNGAYAEFIAAGGYANDDALERRRPAPGATRTARPLRSSGARESWRASAATSRSIRTSPCSTCPSTRPRPTRAGRASGCPTEAEWEKAARAEALYGRRRGVGMDVVAVRRLSGLRGVSLRGVLRGVLRGRVPSCCAADPGQPIRASRA